MIELKKSGLKWVIILRDTRDPTLATSWEYKDKSQAVELESFLKRLLKEG